MGSLCSKRKGSDAGSERSDVSSARPNQLDTANAYDISSHPIRNGANSGALPGGSGTMSANIGGNVTSHGEAAAAAHASGACSGVVGALAKDEGKDMYPLPQEVKKQTENVRNLLLGKVTKVKPVQKFRKITLYICAASGDDCHLEKAKFHTDVYPALREHCSLQGYELHITDLHWQTELEDQQDHHFPELCLEELKRQLQVSYVIPVLFLSNRLGPTLLPKTIEQQDFETAKKNVLDPNSVNLLESWYSLDTQSQPPCYQLRPIASNIPNFTSEKEADRRQAIEEWKLVAEQILDIMLKVFSAELRDTYLTSVIEQEIHNCIFMSREVAKRCIWAQRVFTHIQVSNSSNSSALEKERHRRLESLQNELKSQLTGDHILRLLVKWQDGGLSEQVAEHAQYLQEFSKQLNTQLQSVIGEIIEEDCSKYVWKSCYGIEGALCSEIMQQSVFCQQAAKISPSTENVLIQIRGYVGNADSNYPLVLHGPRGSGKTSFLAKAVQQCVFWFPTCFLVYRFAGLTPESRSLLHILRTVTYQVSQLLNGRSPWIPHTIECYQKELYRLVSAATAPPLIIIVIDGVDELSFVEPSTFDWLSEKLPAQLRLILSCADGTSVFQTLQAKIRHDSAFQALPEPNQSSAIEILMTLNLQYNHSVDEDVNQALKASLSNCHLPLYIKILTWLASIDKKFAKDLSGVTDVQSAMTHVLDCLENLLGKAKVEKALELMCVSRYGLSDSEMLDLLASLPVFNSSSTSFDWAPASVFMAQLYRVLEPFLEWGVAGDAVIVRWRDSPLFDLAKSRYAGSGSGAARKTLVDYFSGTLQGQKKGRSLLGVVKNESSRHNKRRLEEIPVQRYYLEKSIRDSLILNVDWLVQKIRHSSVYSVLEDILLEADGKLDTDPDMSLLARTLELSASALSCDGRQFYGQIYGRLLHCFSKDAAPENPSWTAAQCPFMKKLFDLSQKPSVASFLPLTRFLKGPQTSAAETNFTQLSKGEAYFSEITRMKDGNQYVVSLATAKEEVIVWDVYAEKPVRTLKGVQNPNSLKIIDEHRCVILSGRELEIYNLDDGSFITKLKGVMNQKMPYYGLHDSNHIVALSRNRMYVNLMNMESGDCVTTFKVGEDRFLNSLIVSDNGKILVCGDETQKPFPLLVWDLTSRKLLYDLRIPHHEFITSLSAITKEGHFVCCVCREVDDPGPNFIVVYDLQSGTLFKKWKPGVSTQAIAISAQGGCVINALEDNRILVWDLVTGACQYSLSKHTAPVDILRLDQKGSRCLSCDSTGRDRMACLWDLTNGTLLASFTPDLPFTACEVSNDGDGVVLGLRGSTDIVTLLYRDNVSLQSNRVIEQFGSEVNQGKITDLKSSAS